MSSEVEHIWLLKLRFLDFVRNDNDKLCKHVRVVVRAVLRAPGILVSDTRSAEDSELYSPGYRFTG